MSDYPVALVTGAARGIGLAIAQSLIAAGYRVMAADLGGDQAWNYQLGQSGDIAQALHGGLSSVQAAFDAGGQNGAADAAVDPGADPYHNSPPRHHQPGHGKERQDSDDRQYHQGVRASAAEHAIEQLQHVERRRQHQ